METVRPALTPLTPKVLQRRARERVRGQTRSGWIAIFGLVLVQNLVAGADSAPDLTSVTLVNETNYLLDPSLQILEDEVAARLSPGWEGQTRIVLEQIEIATQRPYHRQLVPRSRSRLLPMFIHDPSIVSVRIRVERPDPGCPSPQAGTLHWGRAPWISNEHDLHRFRRQHRPFSGYLTPRESAPPPFVPPLALAIANAAGFPTGAH